MDELLVVRRETYIAAPRATVFAFLTDPEKILRWMGTEATTEPHPGGLYLVKEVSGRPAVRPGSVHGGRSRPPPRLQLRLGGRPGGAAGLKPGRNRPARPGGRHARAHDP